MSLCHRRVDQQIVAKLSLRVSALEKRMAELVEVPLRFPERCVIKLHTVDV